MADKASRALVICGDGYASLVSPSHSNLHSFASLSSCGLLSLRQDSHVPGAENDRKIIDLAQLLDAYDLYVSMNQNPGESDAIVNQESLLPKISDRFIGLRAAIFTDCPSVQSFAHNLGFTILQKDKIIKENSNDDTIVPSEVLQLLGFNGGDVEDQFEFDLVFLHFASAKKMTTNKDVDCLDKFVGSLVQEVQPRSSVASRLHLSIVLSYESVSEGAEKCSLITKSSKETDSDLYLLRPRQSYTMKGGMVLNNVRHHHPMLIAQWQDGVTRKDLAKAFTFEEFKENGGNQAILADRFLHEVAFKLWKAPKYGA